MKAFSATTARRKAIARRAKKTANALAEINDFALKYPVVNTIFNRINDIADREVLLVFKKLEYVSSLTPADADSDVEIATNFSKLSDEDKYRLARMLSDVGYSAMMRKTWMSISWEKKDGIEEGEE